MIPQKILGNQRCAFMYFGGQNKTNKELFLIVKFDEASSAVSPFKHYFLFETSQFIVV